MPEPRCSAPSRPPRSTRTPSARLTNSRSRCRPSRRQSEPLDRMTDAIYPQVRIVTERLLNPDTVERIMNLIVATGGVRRAILNGPRLPATITVGPAKGQPNTHDMRKIVKIGDQTLELQVHVGTILLELENRDVIPAI